LQRNGEATDPPEPPLLDATRGARSRLGLNAVLNAGGSLSYYAAVVLITPVAIHALGDRSWGIWQLVGAATSYATLLNLGLSSAVAYHVSGALAAKDHERLAESVNNARLYFLAAGAVIALAFALGGRPLVESLLEPDEIDVAWTTLAVSIGITVLTLPVRVYQSVISGLQRYDLLAGSRLAGGVLLLGGVLGGFAAGMGLVGFAFVMTLVPTAPALLSWLFTRRLLPRDSLRWRAPVLRHLARMMTYSASTVLYSTGTVVLYQTMKLAASWRCGGTVAAGHMGLTVSLVQVLSVLFIPLAAVLQPRVSDLHARGRGAEIAPLLRRSLASLGLVAVPVLAFLLLEARTVFAAWVGGALAPDVIDRLAATARYMVIGQGLWVVFLPLFYALLGVGEHRVFGLGMLAAGVANAALGWLATAWRPSIEALGAAFAVTLGALVLFVTVPFTLRRFALKARQIAWSSLVLPALAISPAALLPLRPRVAEPLLDLALAAGLFALCALPGWLLVRRRLLPLR
jgi:O-antigen/teichoic acid export membrane protein